MGIVRYYLDFLLFLRYYLSCIIIKRKGLRQVFDFSVVIDIGVVALRILLPLYAIFIVYQCYAAMRRRRRPEKPLVTLMNTRTFEKIPVLFWENAIGRKKSNDVVVEDAAVSKVHAVLLRRDEGWFINDTESLHGTFVNGKRVEGFPRRFDDGVELGLEGKAKDSPFLDDQTDARLELDGPCEECLSGRHDDTATALARTAVDGSLYGSLVVAGCGRRLSTHASDDYGVRAELRRLNALFDLAIERLVPLTGEGEQRRQAEQEGKKEVSGHRW